MVLDGAGPVLTPTTYLVFYAEKTAPDKRLLNLPNQL